MGDLCQIAQHGQRVGPLGVLGAQFGQGSGSITAQDHIHQIQYPPPVSQTQHGADLIGSGFACTVRNRLIQQRGGIAHGSFCGAGDQRQGIFGDLSALRCGNLAHQRDHHFGLNPAQIIALTSGQNSHGHFADFGCGKDEFDVGGRLFQGFQQRVKGAGGEHMHLIDDIDLIAGRGRAILDRIDNFSNVADTGAAGSIHLHHIDMAAFHDRGAMFTDTAGFGGWLSGAIRADAVHPFGDDPRCGGFAGSADPGHDKCLGDAIGFKGIFQRSHHGVLTDQIGKCLGAVFPRQDLILGLAAVACAVVHRSLAGFGRRDRVRARYAGGRASSTAVDQLGVRGPEFRGGARFGARSWPILRAVFVALWVSFLGQMLSVYPGCLQ